MECDKSGAKLSLSILGTVALVTVVVSEKRQHKRQNTTCFVKAVVKTVGIFQQNSESGGIFISKTELQKWIPLGESHESIPIWKIKDAPRCSRCGDRGAELHHWAPKEIFGEDEAELWPKDYLCVTCHRDWHGKINFYRTAST